MSDRHAPQMSSLQGGRFLATAWPVISAGDSESLRRRKIAVRAGHLAMSVMALLVMLGAVLTDPVQFSGGRIVVLGAASAAFVLWNLIGTRGIVGLVLWDKGVPPPIESRVPHFGALPYFAVQIALSGLVYLMADVGRVPNLVWLALLPPVAYAVFMLEWRGIATVSLLMTSVLFLNAFRWHGLNIAAYAAVAFFFAVLFTLVFTLLAVHSERARNNVQRLAEELGEANRRLREYAVQVEELASSRERNRIAREIHDSLGHYLTVVNVQIEAARALESTDPARAREAMGKAQSFTQEGLQDIRRSLAALRASPLDNKSIADALLELVTNSSGGAFRRILK